MRCLPLRILSPVIPNLPSLRGTNIEAGGQQKISLRPQTWSHTLYSSSSNHSVCNQKNPTNSFVKLVWSALLSQALSWPVREQRPGNRHKILISLLVSNCGSQQSFLSSEKVSGAWPNRSKLEESSLPAVNKRPVGLLREAGEVICLAFVLYKPSIRFSLTFTRKFKSTGNSTLTFFQVWITLFFLIDLLRWVRHERWWKI